MWQFMRGTGKGYGLRVDSWVDERRDPVKATDAAARHLRYLRERFGSLYLAAAAYNAGAGKVSRSLGKLAWDVQSEPAVTADDSVDAAGDESDSDAPDLADADTAATDTTAADLADATDSTAADGMADTLEPSAAGAAPVEDVVTPPAQTMTSDAAFFRLASNDLLATETQDYVPKLIAAAIIAKDPERYGFSSPAPAPLAYDSLVVHDATGLDVIAKLSGSSLAEIRDLNPQYLRLATPPRSTAIVRLPPGTEAEVAQRYQELSPNARVHYLTHVAGRNERWTGIAARYRLPVRDIRAANPKVRSSRPARGTRLVIPTVAIPSALAMRATGTVGSGRASHVRGATHRVRRGETLTGIARRYRVSVRSLRRVNALAVHQTLRAGMRLRIPG
jgi:membrane-bound lytic murein transglycosylase D